MKLENSDILAGVIGKFFYLILILMDGFLVCTIRTIL